MSSRQLEEIQEEAANNQLANKLGISYDELSELQWSTDTNESNDGLIYEYVITFDESSPIEILEKINGIDLEGRYVYLSPWDDYYEEDIEWDIVSSEQLSALQNHLKSSLNLLNLAVVDTQTEFDLYVMLHTHIVASIEAFLASSFIHEVTNSDELTRKLIETDPEIGKKELTLKEIYKEHENIKTIVAKYLKDLIFHRLKKIKPMYMSVLDVDFGNISWLFKAVELRHHCVHRAGYDKNGNKIQISKNDIETLVKHCDTLSKEISTQIDKSKKT